MAASSSAERTLAGEPKASEPSGITACCGTSAPAPMRQLLPPCAPLSTNSRTVLSSLPPMKINALHITRDSIRIFVPLRPLYGVPVYPSAGGDAHIAPRQVRWCPGGQDHPPYDGMSGTAFSRSTGNQRAAHGRLCFTSIKKRPPYWVVVLAGAERLELSTRGFGDRCSTN